MRRLQLFDECINGEPSKLLELVDPMFEHFNLFFKIYKENSINKKMLSVTYHKESDTEAIFELETSSNVDIINENDCVKVDKNSVGLRIDINMREE